MEKMWSGSSGRHTCTSSDDGTSGNSSSRPRRWPILLAVLLVLSTFSILREQTALAPYHSELNSSQNNPVADEESSAAMPVIQGLAHNGSKDGDEQESATTSITTTTTAWCVLHPQNTQGPRYFFHFPHFLQSMALCWSWYATFPADANTQRGVLTRELPGFGSPHKDWRTQLLHVMNCKFQYGTPEDLVQVLEENTDGHAAQNHIFFEPPLQDVENDRYFWNPDDAANLRTSFLNLVAQHDVTVPRGQVYVPPELEDTKSTSTTTNTTQRKLSSTSDNNDAIVWATERPPRVQIGLIDRKKTRRFLTANKIAQTLAKRYANMADVQLVYMEDMTPLEQMLWWSRMDVVVMAHGAAAANMICMRRNAAVVEVFPLHYYRPMYELLGASMGVRTYGYYNGVADPAADCEEYAPTFAQRSAYRKVDIEPEVKDIVELVDQAIREEGNQRWTWMYPL